MIKKLVPAEIFILLPKIYKTNFLRSAFSYNRDEREEPKSLEDTKIFFSPFKVFM